MFAPLNGIVKTIELLQGSQDHATLVLVGMVSLVASLSAGVWLASRLTSHLAHDPHRRVRITRNIIVVSLALPLGAGLLLWLLRP